MVMIFLAREATATTQFDAKRTEIVKNDSAMSAEESVAGSSTSMASSELEALLPSRRQGVAQLKEATNYL